MSRSIAGSSLGQSFTGAFDANIMSLFITFEQSLISTICLHALFCTAQPDWSRCFEIRVGLFGLEKKLETAMVEEVSDIKVFKNGRSTVCESSFNTN